MNKESQSSLHQKLKHQTIELHKKAHNIPYIANLLKNDIKLISYKEHVHAFSIIYEALEHQISDLQNETVKEIMDDYSRRLSLLLSDLEYLKAKELKEIEPAINHAKHVADKILLYSNSNPYKLLGFIYTLEGSINGASVLKKHITRTFNFENNYGTMYLSCCDDRFVQYWKGFTNKLNTKISEEKHKDDVMAAALEIFIDLMKIYESLSPVDEK